MLPLFIQIACSATFEYVQAGGKITGESDIKEVEEIFFDEARPHFQYVWDTFNEDTKDICRAILAREEIDEDRRNILIDLTRRGYVLEKDNEYRLFSSTFANRIVAEDVKRPKVKSSGTGIPLKKGGKGVVPASDLSGDRLSEAIMVVDVCKHSSIMQKLGGRDLVAMLSALDSIVREASERHGCQYMSSRGDGYLTTFPTASDAVSAALSILAQVEEHNKSVEKNRKIFVRFAVNYGETILGPSGERIGERVNETFRMEELRQADLPDWGKADGELPERGYILASERVYNELRDSKDLSFRLLGVFELRGLPGLHRIYELVSYYLSNGISYSS